MMANEQITALEKENRELKKQLEKKSRKAEIQDDWIVVKTWAASFGVRLLIVGGAIFFLIILPSVIVGGLG